MLINSNPPKNCFHSIKTVSQKRRMFSCVVFVFPGKHPQKTFIINKVFTRSSFGLAHWTKFRQKICRLLLDVSIQRPLSLVGSQLWVGENCRTSGNKGVVLPRGQNFISSKYQHTRNQTQKKNLIKSKTFSLGSELWGHLLQHLQFVLEMLWSIGTILKRVEGGSLGNYFWGFSSGGMQTYPYPDGVGR